jgi:phosphoglycerate dehydrogenase-like enzyme
MKVDRRWPPSRNVPGAYGSTVGIISLGMAGSRVAELLRSFEVKVLAYDPFVAQEKARSLNVEMCPLEEVFLRSDVVTLHTPWLKETEGMITGRHFASMRSGATFINTARGAVVREQEMIQVLKERPDLFAVLDVTWPEPPESDSALYSLPNVILTPHIAGAMGPECRRLGRYMVEELQRYVAGRPLRWAITREQARLLA